MYDVLIIGAGITGCSIAYYLSRYNLRIALVEKENDLADGTTKANSAIVHAGYDPHPGTLMAKYNVRGCALTEELCQKLSVPYQKIGSYVLAFDEADCRTLDTLLERGRRNGVPGLRILSGEEARRDEPNLSPEVKAALYAPSAGIVAPWSLAIALGEVAVRNGVELFLQHEVRAIARQGDGFVVTAGQHALEARYVINCAGIHSAQIHNLVAKPFFSIHPNRGQYYLLDHSEGEFVHKVIFQCPSKVGKGVLVSPTVHGNLLVGPDSEPVEGENLATTRQGLDYVLAAARRSCPGLSVRQSIRNFAGVRAAAEIDDFIIGPAPDAPHFIDVAGVKSPGLTSAPAIGEDMPRLLAEAGLALEPKAQYEDSRAVVRFKELSPEEKNALIHQNPAYGRVICRCETVTEGEILDAIHSPIPPRSLDAVKRRCNAGMGRCQGGFCGPRVLDILVRELQIPPEQVLQDKNGSFIITGRLRNGGAQ